jgi:hypothetical protein
MLVAIPALITVTSAAFAESASPAGVPMAIRSTADTSERQATMGMLPLRGEPPSGEQSNAIASSNNLAPAQRSGPSHGDQGLMAPSAPGPSASALVGASTPTLVGEPPK